LLIALMGVALAYGTWTPPTSVSDCFTHTAPSDAMKAKFEQMRNCSQACFTAAGMKPNTAHKTCFENAKSAAKTFFTGNKEIQTNKANFQKCVTSTCTTAQASSQSSHSSHHMMGPHAYNASSPMDQKMCSKGLLMEVMKGSAPTMSSSAKSTMHTCLEACHPMKEEQSSSQSSSHSSMSHHHRRMNPMQRNMMCLKHFCSKSEFETCRPPKDATLEASVHTFMSQQFTTLCGCLGGTTAQCTVSDSTCSALFTSMEAKMAAWKAAHSSQSSSS